MVRIGFSGNGDGVEIEIEILSSNRSNRVGAPPEAIAAPGAEREREEDLHVDQEPGGDGHLPA